MSSNSTDLEAQRDAYIEARDRILGQATRIARNNDPPEQRHRTLMIRCWRNTLRLEEELGWEPSPSVLTALEETPEDIRDPETRRARRTKPSRSHGQRVIPGSLYRLAGSTPGVLNEYAVAPYRRCRKCGVATDRVAQDQECWTCAEYRVTHTMSTGAK